MKFRKQIALFLLLVLSVQVLPLQQIAAWLTSGQVTEEIAHAVNPVKAKSGTSNADPEFTIPGMAYLLPSSFSSDQDPSIGSEALYLRHADDILTPPPNC